MSLFYSYSSSPIATPPIKTNKVLRTSAKLNNNNNNINDSSCKVNNPPTGKRSTRTSSGSNVPKRQKINNNSTSADNNISSTFGNSNSENEQSPREPWNISPNKSIKSEKTKEGVVLRSSGRIPKNWKCNNPLNSTPHKISTLSKIKTPLTEPITRTLRSQKKNSRRFINMKSRSSWSAGMVTRSHKRNVKC